MKNIFVVAIFAVLLPACDNNTSGRGVCESVSGEVLSLGDCGKIETATTVTVSPLSPHIEMPAEETVTELVN